MNFSSSEWASDSSSVGLASNRIDNVEGVPSRGEAGASLCGDISESDGEGLEAVDIVVAIIAEGNKGIGKVERRGRRLRSGGVHQNEGSLNEGGELNSPLPHAWIGAVSEEDVADGSLNVDWSKRSDACGGSLESIREAEIKVRRELRWDNT